MRRLLPVAVALMGVMTAGCDGVVIHRQGPPSHAPAWGVRAHYAHHYLYYPSLGVYHCDIHNDWYYCEGGSWITVGVLPETIVVTPEVTFVEVECAGDAPYVYVSEHRQKYPSHWKSSSPPGKGRGRWK